MAPIGRLAALLVCFFLLYVAAPSSASGHGFLQCLTTSIPSDLVLTQKSPSFEPVLVSSIRNARQLGPAKASPPLAIVTPTTASHVRSSVLCSVRHGVRIRVRSGGHDYEGVSYRSTFSHEPFAVLDLFNLHSVRVDAAAATAWVDSGASIGELYYAIAKAAPGLAFPAGVCPTIGVGGHFSGGGIGLMMRKYGLSADNVIDATIVDATGNLLEGKAAIGEDLFWAIRGGGGGSFGIVLSWKVRLVPVPPKITFFDVGKTIEQGAAGVLTKWQTVAPALPDDLSIRAVVLNRTVRFQGLYLGPQHEALRITNDKLPELGATAKDSRELSWVQYTAYIYFGDTATPLEALLNRTFPVGSFLKHKSDYVKTPIPEATWEKILSWPFGGATDGQIILEPHGGRVGAAVPDDETPFPHRAGVLYNIQYVEVYPANLSTSPPSWVSGLYDFVEPLVSSNPRSAYVNYRDLDIGVNKDGVASYESAKVWGERYFGAANFLRLARIKAKVDPENHFRHEQSVPPLLNY
ncbi:berberine bridge enzyme-like 27 [Brachypodium distachyon]|uniref:FAD-binding PCMH-type domain-containing protein n=1 Tax=Brachypodium distachyon TaxID=15368 RepID=I1IW41_BRADI|nr:berberine bridge enzyme-like 27 [Brachypodium distachyon]KQJ81772.1 hypothetical protein BRADI_5g02967v3 [Brachypodium distachyon]|eukprot:XP_003581022.1 berberine bridge enzyme-like 27 [Brachypodium distachyon]